MIGIQGGAREVLFASQTSYARERTYELLDGIGARRFAVGKSIFGQDIWAYRVGKGQGRVAFFATHHALEDVGTCVLYAIIYILSDPDRKEIFGIDRDLLLSTYSYYFIPLVNPDGVELRYGGEPHALLRERLYRMSGGDFSRWQANGRGVDLNHNYDFGFAEYKRWEVENVICPGATLYSGESPESEPECAAVMRLIRSVGFSAVVSLHSQGREIFYSPKDERTVKLAGKLSSLTGYSLSMPEGSACYGGLCDYTGSLGIPSFTFELGKGINPLPETDRYPIFERVAEALVRLPTLL